MQLRFATPDDASAVQAIYAHYCSTPITFEMEPPSVAEMKRRIESTVPAYPWLLAVDGNNVLGYAYGHAFRDRPAYRWTVETTIYVSPDARQRRVGATLYTALLDLLKRQGFVSAIAAITVPNDASVSLHKKFGFRETGRMPNVGFKCGTWHEVAWLHLQLNTPANATAEMPEPVAINSSMATSDEIGKCLLLHEGENPPPGILA